MTRQVAPEEVREVLGRRAFAELIGVVEDEHVECKQMPYQLNSEAGKYELAKDVSAFANAAGGVILIGFRTGRPDPAHPQDEITHVRVVPQAQINRDQYHDVLRAWTFPPLDGVEITWYSDPANPDSGVLAIYVNADPALQPCLITRVVDDPARPAVERFCAYVERRRAAVSAMSVQEIQASLRMGRSGVVSQIERLETVAARIDRAFPEQAAQTVPPPPGEVALQGHVPNVVVAEPLDGVIAAALEAAGMRSEPAWILAAQPAGTTTIRNFLGSESVSGLLREPPVLRRDGFDTTTGVDRAGFDGQKRRAVVRGHKLLEVTRHGRIVFVATAGPDFLAWGSSEGANLRINPLALAESAYAFAVFVEQVEPQLEMHFNTRTYRAEVRAAGRTVEVVPFPLFTVGWEFARELRALEADIIVDLVVPSDTPPEVVAFQICAEIYARFGIDAEAVPYSLAGPRGRQLDIRRIERGGRE